MFHDCLKKSLLLSYVNDTVYAFSHTAKILNLSQCINDYLVLISALYRSIQVNNMMRY
jgi:hypothetical protein